MSTTSSSLHGQRRQGSIIPKTSDPLHILFCGSDNFSCASLKALHHEHIQNPGLIRSIDVVLRPGKRVGRGHANIRDPPIRQLAASIGLPIHERDTFTGWDMPQEINLIIAVSFGLFVPPRLLKKAKYGGLNVHPSLLPDLRGPAPLQHALLAGHTLTGVSLQTLDDKAFDHGTVLAQTPSDPRNPNAILIPRSVTTLAELQALVTPAATTLLVEGLRANLHVPPYKDIAPKPETPLLHAPKITTQDRQLTLDLLRDFDADSSGMLTRRHNAIGPLWFLSRNKQGHVKRIIIHDLVKLHDVSGRNRPCMIEAAWDDDMETDTITDNNATTTDTNATTTTTNTTIFTKDTKTKTKIRKRYPIPFLETRDNQPLNNQDLNNQDLNNQDPDNQDPDNPNPDLTITQKAKINLVFWDEVNPTAPPRTPGQPAKGDAGELRLGNYLVKRLQVEAEKVKPAWVALHQFI